MTEKTLKQIHAEHRGKVSDKWSLYLQEYDRVFASHRFERVRLLEIGVQNGGSLEVWSKYFPHAQKVVGCDVNPDCARLAYEDPRIALVIGDATDHATRQRILEVSPGFDLVIDDGSHRSADIIKAFTHYFPLLSDGGIYVVEDLHCSYWQQFDGGLFHPLSSVSFFKLLADVLNGEHWGVHRQRVELLQEFFSRHGVSVAEADLDHLHSIEFINSMCVVRKDLPAANRLGTQNVAGDTEAVVTGRLACQSRASVAPDQSANPWNRSLQSELADARAELENARALLAASRREADAHLAQIQEHGARIETLRARAAEYAAEVSRLQAALGEILESTSWRSTALLRRVGGVLRKSMRLQPHRVLREFFDAEAYFTRYPDVKASGMGAYEHYVAHGAAEGRLSAFPPYIQASLDGMRTARGLAARVRRHPGGVSTMVRNAVKVARTEGLSGVRRRLKSSNAQEPSSGQQALAYARYIEWAEPSEADLERMRSTQESFRFRPKFSIAVPVYNVEERWLRQFVASVQAQVYPDWELCIADDCSTAPHIRPLLEEFAAGDARIKVTFRASNGHISAATNTAIELATGDFICLMDNDDEIAPHALYEFANVLDSDPGVDMIYSDEDKLDMDGRRYEPFFKPDWSPEALEGCMYTAHFACYRTQIVRAVGGFRTGYDGAQDYDFVLRFTEQAGRIVHVPKILYHWRAIPGSTAASMHAKDYVLDAALRALGDRARRMGGGGEARLGRYPGSFDLRYAIRGEPKVSIVIPSAGRSAQVRGSSIDLLVNVVSSIHANTTYRNFEIVIVDNKDLRESTLRGLAAYGCRFVHFEGDFNIATKMNMGAAVATGEYLLFMNDDIEVIKSDWLECMLQLAQREGVGAVGAKLLFENGTVQHAGVAFWQGLPDHICRESGGDDPGHFFSACANRNYLAVTGAVLLTRKSLFDQVGGFDERFAINYNDIDYCLKVFQARHRVVFAAGAELYHFESISRARTVAEGEIDLFLQKWRALTLRDPYYSPVFEDHPPTFALRSSFEGVVLVPPLESAVLS